MITKHRCFLVVVILLVATILVFAPSQASNINLAKDYPYNILFLAMVERGIKDYALEKDAWPADIVTAQELGYFSYLVPLQLELEFTQDGEWANLSSIGRPVVSGETVSNQPLDSCMKLPDQTPYHVSNGMQARQVGTEIEYYNAPHKAYHWDGAQWADQYSKSDIMQALVYKRLAIHLAYASREYISIEGEPPQDFEQLEEFMGVARNPAAWQNVNLANSPIEVPYIAGSLFVGWDEGQWKVMCNLGPEVFEYFAKPGNTGGWMEYPSVISY